MKYFGLSETKLFYYNGIFKKNELKSAERTPIPLYTRTPLYQDLTRGHVSIFGHTVFIVHFKIYRTYDLTLTLFNILKVVIFRP